MDPVSSIAAEMEEYSHQPLETSTYIRIIELLPGDQDATLTCHIHQVDLDRRPDYEAISYTWGGGLETILCDGKALSITENLASALRRFRRAGPNAASRVLWADGICINQENTEAAKVEKSVQVPLMGRVYGQATQVLIWLGAENEVENTKAALECVKDLCDNLRPKKWEFLDWEAKHLSRDEIYELRGNGSAKSDFLKEKSSLFSHFHIKPSEHTGYDEFVKLFVRRWFIRAWTFQESWLAQKRHFYCGQYELSGDDLLFGQVALAKIHAWTAIGRFNFRRPYYMLEGKGYWRTQVKDTLIDLICLRRGAGCTRPHDILYSIFGSVNDTLGIKVDYEREWQALFAEFTYKQMIRTESLSLLGEVDCESTVQGLPSWVPDWTAYYIRPRSLTQSTQRAQKTYFASGSSLPKLELSPDLTTLSIFGIEVDSIQRVIGTAFPDMDSWAKECLTLYSNGLYLPTGEDLSTVTCRVRTADLAIHDEENPKARWGLDAIERINYLANVERGPKYIAWIKNQIIANSKSSGFTTSGGRIGSGPQSLQIGDIVILAAGGEVPLLLRRVTGEESYRFAGECYVHGIMDGEALLEARAGADPAYNKSDKSWLDGLHIDDFPLELREFRLR